MSSLESSSSEAAIALPSDRGEIAKTEATPTRSAAEIESFGKIQMLKELRAPLLIAFLTPGFCFAVYFLYWGVVEVATADKDVLDLAFAIVSGIFSAYTLPAIFARWCSRSISKTVEHLAGRIKVLEELHDKSRSSSKLNSDGTNPNDI